MLLNLFSFESIKHTYFFLAYIEDSCSICLYFNTCIKGQNGNRSSQQKMRTEKENTGHAFE